MGKRIDLSKKTNNSDNRPNKQSHPFYLNDEEIEDNDSNNNNDELINENGVEEEISNIANKLIMKRTSQSSIASFAAGIPGGLAMAATIPADSQFYSY